MKRKLLIGLFAVLLLMGSGAYLGLYVHERFQEKPVIEVYFSPHGGCTEAIVREVEGAKSEILSQSYSFTSKPIAEAFVDKFKQMKNIEAILDKSQKTAHYSSATFLANSKIPTYIDAAHAIAHNKIIIIDRSTVLTGSFNHTDAAEKRNAENLVIIRSKKIAEKYRENWKHHKDHSEVYEPRL
jgi:phosphatidylserine/phosphatidylglycerophosphate/cardiolipin synthase-like enzyme